MRQKVRSGTKLLANRQILKYKDRNQSCLYKEYTVYMPAAQKRCVKTYMQPFKKITINFVINFFSQVG
jgi:hypothetical protein